MACPYRHREVSASDILDMTLVDCCKREVAVKDDLWSFER